MVTTESMPRCECSLCGRTFARQAHLERHQETHRGSPRWSCHSCHSSYTRRDALNRHLSRCSAAASDARVPSSRINRTCQACSVRKVRCSRGQPCQRCADLAIPCHYLVHGSARQIPAPTSPLPLPSPPPDMSMPSEVATSSTGNDDDTALPNTLEQQHTTVSSEDHRDLLDPINPNPWLSWEWSEQPWDFLEPVPSMPTDRPREHNLEHRSYFANPFGIDGADVRSRATNIIDARIDPVENHRQTIIAYVQKLPGSGGQGENVQWLIDAQFPLLLKTYFMRHHRHTPIIHLPTFDIVACPTSLIFALALIAASYMPKLGLRATNIVVLAKCAYQFALETDESFRGSGVATLETLQALVLLGILDRLMVNRKPGSQFCIDLGEIVRLVRTAGMFEAPSEPSGISWSDWALMESRRRLALVLFAFDAFVSVLHDEIPSVRTDELNLHFPSPEFMFVAASDAEWREAEKLRYNKMAAACTVSLTLSSLFCNVDQPALLPNTLMGRFVLLHGILQHAWRTKRVLQENAYAMSAPTLEAYVRSKESAVHSSLQKWRTGWPEELLDFEPLSESPSLYQDRAEAYWYLAGIIILPHVVIASPKTSVIDTAGVLSVQQTLECLMNLSDQSRLRSAGQDFDAVYSLVTEQNLFNVGNGALGTLIYREADRTTAGFAE